MYKQYPVSDRENPEASDRDFARWVKFPPANIIIFIVGNASK